MNRGEFLAHVGAGLLAVVGFSGIVKTLLDYNRHRSVSNGYGGSSYGGRNR